VRLEQAAVEEQVDEKLEDIQWFALARFSRRTRRVRRGGFEPAPQAIGSATRLSFFSLFGTPNKRGPLMQIRKACSLCQTTMIERFEVLRSLNWRFAKTGTSLLGMPNAESLFR
jgi:hypothetical protein